MATRQSLIPWVVLLASGCALVAGGCAIQSGPPPPRVSQWIDSGDDRFRASQRLVIEGLEADERGAAASARGRYERALQIDSSNPWAYLALSRHHLDAGQGRQALRYAERAEALFESLDLQSRGVEIHCQGLRGAALALEGRDAEARPLLDAAARGAPGVWDDGRLSAAELR